MLERRKQNLPHTEITMPAFTLFVALSTSNQSQSMPKHQSASKLSLSLSASVLLLTSLMSLTVHAEDTISIDTSTAPSAKVQETKRMVIVRPSQNNSQNTPQFPSQNQSQTPYGSGVPYGSSNSSQMNSYATINNPQSIQYGGADSMERLIDSREGMYSALALAIEENTRIRAAGSASVLTRPAFPTGFYNPMDFNQWLNAYPYRKQQVADYQQFLASRVGSVGVPPMNQLLTTARSWQKCGHEPYEVPPRYLWDNMVPTLQLYNTLKAQGIVPQSAEIRSVYRNPSLNVCAGGAGESKHLTNGAVDIWVPDQYGYDFYTNPLQDGLCQFWQYQGEAYNFGLGLYGTGSIHLDTQGYRKWGEHKTPAVSPCRW